MPIEQKVTRKLSAILSADVKGYSLLMADDEVHTIETLTKYRQIMSNLVQQHSGRVVDNPGDNMLAEFSSAVDAVACAVEVQKKLEKENSRFVKGMRLQFRIGVNIGDVVQDGDRIYGSGVNLAARIEGIADPGGVCISRNTYDHVKGKLELKFEYLGEHEVKNIEEPVRVYRVLLDSESHAPLVDELPELPDRPSIAVLPFDNMSGDSSQEYFSDGMTEQIINGLCKIPSLFVTARYSSFSYKGKSISIKQIARELGVQYILEGSVQASGNRVRITAQLINALTDYHIWSESFDRKLSDIFALQDEITLKIIDALQAKLTFGEQAGHWGPALTTNIQLYDKCMRGWECLCHLNKRDMSKVKIIAKDILTQNPECYFAHALLGFANIFDLMYRWTESPLDSFVEAEKAAEKAVALDENIDLGHSLLGWILLFKHQHDEAMMHGERAIELNPNGADAHALFAFILNLSGQPNKGLMIIDKAIRFNPNPPSYYYIFAGTSYRMIGQYEKSIQLCKKSIKLDPDQVPPHLILAVSYSSLNLFADAHKAAKEVLRLDPSFSIDYYSKTIPFKNQNDLNLYMEGLRKAGLPE